MIKLRKMILPAAAALAAFGAGLGAFGLVRVLHDASPFAARVAPRVPRLAAPVAYPAPRPPVKTGVGNGSAESDFNPVAGS